MSRGAELPRYRRLYTRLWRHPGFLALHDSERLLAVYLLTGPQSNRLGLFVLSIATAAEDLGTVPRTLTKRLVKVCQTFGWLFDRGSRVFYIPSWWRWNPPDNENIVKGSLKDLNEIPPCGLVDAFAKNLETVPETVLQTFLEGLRQRLPNGSRTQDQDQDQDQEQEPALRAKGGRDEPAHGPDPKTVAARIEALAKQISRDERLTDQDYQIDALQAHLKNDGIRIDRAGAIQALIAATPSGRR